MDFKKIIFILFILLSLNTFNQNVQYSNQGKRHTIVRQINFEEDNLTNKVIENNKEILFKEYISILTQIMVINKSGILYNTS